MDKSKGQKASTRIRCAGTDKHKSLNEKQLKKVRMKENERYNTNKIVC